MSTSYISNRSRKALSIDDISLLLQQGQSVAVLADAGKVLMSLQDVERKARLVLIDPPYNRRTKFHHYSDDISTDAWVLERKAHIALLRDQLEDRGSLWMHIDDTEVVTARILLDSIFGKNNFVATVVWQKSVSRDNRTPISTTHEYVLTYAKNKSAWHKSRNKIPAQDLQISRFKNPDNDPRGPWASGDLTAKAGPGRRVEQFYELVTPSGRVIEPSPGTAWRFTWKRMQEMILDGRIYFGSGDRVPRLKRFLSESQPGLVPNTWWSGVEVGTADTAKRHLKEMFPAMIPFETPKPEALASRIIGIATDPGDLVIDVYGGSGTTAAVAHKMGRQWLIAERERKTFEEFLIPRLDLVIAGEDEGGISKPFNWMGGGDFVGIVDNQIPARLPSADLKLVRNHV